jgi:hypothetical protein
MFKVDLMGCIPSKPLSSSSVVKLVSIQSPDEMYFSSPMKTNINPGKSKIIKFSDGLL